MEMGQANGLAAQEYSIAREISSFLDSVKDEGTSIDSGMGLGSADLWATIDGVEYYINVSKARKNSACAHPAAEVAERFKQRQTKEQGILSGAQNDAPRVETNHAAQAAKLAAEQSRSGSVEAPKISGYRQLSKTEIDLVNSIKNISNLVGKMIDTMISSPDIDHRWVHIAATDLQKGFMALTRSVTKPQGF